MRKKILFSLKMLFRPNKAYMKTLRANWCKNIISFVTFELSLVGIMIPFFDFTHLSALMILCISFVVLLFISFLFAIPNCYKKFKIRGTGGNAIELVIGDILDDPYDIVIPSNNYFDTSWEVISEKSIQGQYARYKHKYYSLKQLDESIEDAINRAGLHGEKNEQKIIGKNIRYPIHSIISLTNTKYADSQNCYWIAISNFSNTGSIIKEDVDIHKSIMTLWQHLTTHVRVRDLSIPVIGTGLTPTSVPQFDVIEFIIDSFLCEIQKSKIVDTLRIYLYDKGEDTYTTFHLASQYIQHRIENLSATGLKHCF